MKNDYSHLTLSELYNYPGQTEEPGSGGRIRYFCPIHGGDHQHSLVINPDNGHYTCFQCGAWGYIKGYTSMSDYTPNGSYIQQPRGPATNEEPPEFAGFYLKELMEGYQKALPDSDGQEYLRLRGISLEIAQKYGVGYSPHRQWMGRKSWSSKATPLGRIIFPHSSIDGSIVNLYGRALGKDSLLEKKDKHDHLRGPKGILIPKHCWKMLFT